MPGARSGTALGPWELSRRDVLNGLLLAAGGGAVWSSTPLQALAEQMPGGACDGAIGSDPRALRGGNSRSTFAVAHWLRDGRLGFAPNGVTLAPGCDSREGTFPVADEGEDFDVIVVGGGLAGLSAAFYLLRRRPDLKLILLEANAFAGGNAASDDQAPLPVRASTAGAYDAMPDTDYVRELYRETGVDWNKHIIRRTEGDSYFFDETTPGVKPGYRGWRINMLPSLAKRKTRRPVARQDDPYDQRVMEDLARCVEAFTDWGKKPGAPDEPPDLSDPKYDYLSAMSFASYLTDVLHCDPRVVDFYTSYTADCLGGTPRSVNAHTATSFLSSDYTENLFAYPGGTSEIARQLLHWLTGSQQSTRRALTIELQAVALRVDAEPAAARNRASITYFKDGAFRRVTGKTMIVATQVQSAGHLVEHLLDSERKAAWKEFNTAPALVANVAVRDMTPFVELNLGYSSYYWGSRYWSNFIIADWTTENRLKTKRASVLTFYGAVTAPPEEFAAERWKLLSTPFEDYERSLKDDLSRVMRGTKFDFDRDVSAVFVYRWGHSMILPTTKSVFGNVYGPDGRLDRNQAPRRVACRPLGPISFAGQHTEGTPSVESAIASGHRAALEVLARLRGS
jgi:spermidine dehydrogenase